MERTYNFYFINGNIEKISGKSILEILKTIASRKSNNREVVFFYEIKDKIDHFFKRKEYFPDKY